jgi:hypothetical protein
MNAVCQYLGDNVLLSRCGHAGAAVVCSALMAISWLVMVDVRSLNELYFMVSFIWWHDVA